MRKLSTRRSVSEGGAFVIAVLTLVGITSWATAGSAHAATGSTLNGTLQITAGSCANGKVSGTYIQMILPSGSESGPYMSNSDSTCSDQAYTLLSPGSDGGLRFGSYQPLPSPPFDSDGNARAHAITAPAQYEGTAFATSTNRVDPQTHTEVGPPTLSVHGSKVTADVRSFSVSWNKQYFNQGAPKPDGSNPGITRGATGTYDATTGAMTLSWTSQVVGGPFDKFTGSWHLVGRFVPSDAAAVATPSKAGAAGPAAQPSAASVGMAPDAGARPAAAKPVPHGASVSPAGAADVAAPAVAATSSVTRDTWHVAWWLVALALAIAVLGFGGLLALSRAQRSAETAAS